MKRNLKAIPVLVAGLFTSQLSIAAGSVSADPHAGHDMSAMQMPADENFTEMTSMEPIVTESRTPIPPVTDADRKAAFGNLQGHAIHDSAINYLVLLDQLEWQRSDNTNNFSWSVNSWIGGDTDRIWLKSEGERSNGETEAAEAQLLWGHAVGPWWDLVAGVRQDFRPASARTWAAVGFQGLALYNFESEITGFVSNGGKAALRLGGEYDVLLTNRLILQPSYEVNFYSQDDESRGRGRGLTDTELGLRLRTEAAEAQLLWGHAVGPWWDLVAGVRQDFRPASARTWAAVGFQGLALYNFESEITGFVSNGGKAALRLGGEYDVLLTNRLILQPSYEVNFYSQDDESRGRGRGLTDTELGLRLRYEIRREFAPYIGVSWNQLYGKTSDMAKREGEKDHQVVFLAGARIWF
ncbi:Copper resistance protein B [Klebsiella pneumoniae subsp. pneumoniae ST512-K30BO]|nr:Copper resistance protein B [Klebsiella pneumoniae subsp. pneumoniae ST512-K30BO]